MWVRYGLCGRSMTAMKLPSTLPIILISVKVGRSSKERGRGCSFVTAYLGVWFGFSVAATATQWAFQSLGWVNPMIISTSSLLNGLFLLMAGIHQFSSLKQVCLGRRHTPLVFC